MLTFCIQALFLGICAVYLFTRERRIDPFILISVILWVIGTSVIYYMRGPILQLWFYQNDQYFHWRLLTFYLPNEISWTPHGINFLRAPYAFPAYMIHLTGIDAVLSLKFVSLIALILNYKLVRGYLQQNLIHVSNFHIWLFSGPFLVFFSALALRETTMLLGVSTVFFSRQTPVRIAGIIVLLILRPHLAAAILLGLTLGWLLEKVPQKIYYVTVVFSIFVPILIGTLGFSLGNYFWYNEPFQIYESAFNTKQLAQIFSAFLGLQFLTVAYQTVEYSTTSLFALRVLFPEITLIPLFFASSLLFYRLELTRLKISILISFMFFISLSSATEYLSARQSLPMMSIMAVAIILSTQKKQVVS